MSEPDLLLALAPVLDALERLGVRHYVGGSIASSAHGVARASVDADVVAELRIEHATRLVASLAEGCYVPEERVRDAISRRASFNVIHLRTMLKVDVFVAFASSSRPGVAPTASARRARRRLPALSPRRERGRHPRRAPARAAPPGS